VIRQMSFLDVLSRMMRTHAAATTVLGSEICVSAMKGRWLVPANTW